MIFSLEAGGLVLFHGNHCVNVEPNSLKPGMLVTFLDMDSVDEKRDSFLLRQAVAVWIGDGEKRVGAHLLHQKEHKQDLKIQRDRFIDYVEDRRNSFLHVPIARVQGIITGWLTDRIGLIETDDFQDQSHQRPENRELRLVLFDVRDVYVYQRSALSLVRDSAANPVEKVLPIGLRVMIDARTIPKFRGVSYQAISVFAGAWPSAPHPTLLPSCGGVSSYSRCYEIPTGHSFYYLQLSLRRIMDTKLEAFIDRSNLAGGTELCQSNFVINNGLDFRGWQDLYAPSRFIRNRDSSKVASYRLRNQPKQNYHIFKRKASDFKKKEKVNQKIRIAI